MAPVLPHHVKIDLSKDGTMLEYLRDVLGWFLGHKHFQRERLTEHWYMLWDANNAENMALFAVAQEFKVAYPGMDSGEKVFSIPFKCKGTSYDLALRHYPFPIKITYMGGCRPAFHFKLTVKVLGAKDIIQKKAVATSNACHLNGFDDLYD